jgi:hypothetical protein
MTRFWEIVAFVKERLPYLSPVEFRNDGGERLTSQE